MSSSTIGMDKSSWGDRPTHKHTRTHAQGITRYLHSCSAHSGLTSNWGHMEVACWPGPTGRSAGCSSGRSRWWAAASCCPGTPLGSPGGSYSWLAAAEVWRVGGIDFNNYWLFMSRKEGTESKAWRGDDPTEEPNRSELLPWCCIQVGMNGMRPVLLYGWLKPQRWVSKYISMSCVHRKSYQGHTRIYNTASCCWPLIWFTIAFTL